jgi:hypothetical protein
MPSDKPTEHFVTLFDHKFLPSGLALHDSLLQHARPFHLWVVCMDERVQQQLELLRLSCVTLLALPEVETPELLRIKPTRTRGEYCWTVTSFTFDAVFERDPAVARVTYLDADLYFYRDPASLLDELSTAAKDVLITEHAYAPEYDLTKKAGRFCVQFLTVCNTAGARRVITWWQQRCIEWCFARAEDGKFGDQKYLDQWPTLFADEVHILAQRDQALGPWNVLSRLGRHNPRAPVFYHFHNVRITAPTRVVLYNGYRIGEAGERLYRDYVGALRVALEKMHALGFPTPTLPQRALRDRLKALKNIVLRRYKSVPLR